MRYHHRVSQETSDIFSKVSPDERQRLFKDLAAVRGIITGKGDGDEVYRLVLERTVANMELQCSISFGFPSPKKEKDLLVNFFIGGERYFFKTPVRVDADIVILRMDGDLFHLQRRQNYRIKIPENYQAHLLISKRNKITEKLRGQLYDLSSGGCRVVLMANSPILEPGDHIEGFIQIGRRDTLEIEGTIRHHKLEKAVSVHKQIFGVEFKPLTPLLEGKLFAITMDLHREFFSRLNAKN